jgi:sec-independent protein translocase protein TatA
MNVMLGLLNLGGGEIILILVVVLILFGAKKLPELAKGLGQGIKEFKKATDNASEGMREAMAQSAPSAARRLPPPSTSSPAPECAVSQVPPDGLSFHQNLQPKRESK